MRHIDAVVEANKLAGGTFFDRRTICYFKSKVLPTLYAGKYFVSYDVADDGTKDYAVREVLASGLIKKVSSGYTSKAEALSVIRSMTNDMVTA